METLEQLKAGKLLGQKKLTLECGLTKFPEEILDMAEQFTNLDLPPTLETCTRDVYPKEFTLTLSKSIKLLKDMASAGQHLHEHGIMHGDFYAHNIILDVEANSIIGDFGGASYYEPSDLNIHDALKRLEVRAFGCLVEEMLMLSNTKGKLGFIGYNAKIV